jgi:hypothetical protein
MGKEFPRVLFVTPAAFNHLTGGGVTFSNLFAGWPKDRIATIHNDVVPTSDDVCDRYFVLGRAEIDLFAPLRVVRALRDRQSKTQGSGGGAGAPGPTGRAGTSGLIARIQGDSAPQRVRLTGTLERWIAAFQQCLHGGDHRHPPQIRAADGYPHDGRFPDHQLSARRVCSLRARPDAKIAGGKFRGGDGLHGHI